MGGVIGDLNSRRGKVLSMTAKAGRQIIDAEAPLFVKGLGLDSIDALELGLALQKRYGVSVSSDSEETRRHFGSVKALAAFVTAQRTR